jgi:hypothetical protein
MNRLAQTRSQSSLVQRFYDSFTIASGDGNEHHCFALEPLSIDLGIFEALTEESSRWNLTSFRRFARDLLEALDFLHTEAKLMHGGKQSV